MAARSLFLCLSLLVAGLSDVVGGEAVARQGCLACHRMAGGDGGAARGSDLLFGGGGEWSRSAFVANFWNHAPLMWDRHKALGQEVPSLDAAEIEELLVDLDRQRPFAAERPGSVIAGRQAFHQKRCKTCHDTVSWAAAESADRDLVNLAARLWLEIPKMRTTAADGQEEAWPTLTGSDVRDLLAYFRSLPAPRKP